MAKDKNKPSFFQKLIRPYKYLFQNKIYDYLIWVITVVVFGLINVIMNVIKLTAASSDFWNSLLSAFKTALSDGTFVVLSLVLVASAISMIFTKYANFQKSYGTSKTTLNLVIDVLFIIIIASISAFTSSTCAEDHSSAYYWVIIVVFALAIIESTKVYSISSMTQREAVNMFAETVKEDSKDDYKASVEITKTPDDIQL